MLVLSPGLNVCLEFHIFTPRGLQNRFLVKYNKLAMLRIFGVDSKIEEAGRSAFFNCRDKIQLNFMRECLSDDSRKVNKNGTFIAFQSQNLPSEIRQIHLNQIRHQKSHITGLYPLNHITSRSHFQQDHMDDTTPHDGDHTLKRELSRPI